VARADFHKERSGGARDNPYLEIHVHGINGGADNARQKRCKLRCNLTLTSFNVSCGLE